MPDYRPAAGCGFLALLSESDRHLLSECQPQRFSLNRFKINWGQTEEIMKSKQHRIIVSQMPFQNNNSKTTQRFQISASETANRNLRALATHTTQAAIAFLLFAAFVPMVLGAGLNPVVFVNTNAIIINDSNQPPTTATPYPSPIVVAGLDGEVISKVTVTLSNLSHTFPSDIDALLVGPQGQASFLMSEVGGVTKSSVTNITLTLDDDATNALPTDAVLTSGTFRPTKSHPTNYFDLPSPAPAGNSNTPALLRTFNGSDPNGTWNLFVVDDTFEDSGIISNGWSLSINSGVLLHITPDQTNVLLFWTNSATGYTLQTTTNLSAPTAWSSASPAPVDVAGQLTVTNAAADASRFYRLTK